MSSEARHTKLCSTHNPCGAKSRFRDERRTHKPCNIEGEPRGLREAHTSFHNTEGRAGEPRKDPHKPLPSKHQPAVQGGTEEQKN